MRKLHIYQPPHDFPKLLHFICTQGTAGKPHSGVHLRAKGQTGRFNEMVQRFEYAFQAAELHMVRADDCGELLLVVDLPQSQVRPMVGAAMGQHFPEAAAKAHVFGLDGKGLDGLGQLLGRWIGAQDRAARIGLTRLLRRANVFLLLDDDVMVLRQLEQVLKGFGHVEKTALAGDFLSAYERYAPNLAFVDIHLRDGHGIAIAEQVLTRLDPFAYVVMVTADAVKERVVAASSIGAKAFLAKPINKECVMRHVLGCPTFVKRQGT